MINFCTSDCFADWALSIIVMTSINFCISDYVYLAFWICSSIMSWHRSINQHSVQSFHDISCLVKDTLKLLPAMAPRRLVVAALGKNFDYRHPRSFRAVKHVDRDCFIYAPGKFPFMCLAILDFRWTAGKAAWVPRWLQVTDQSCWVEEPLLGVKAAKVEMSKALKLPA